MQTENAIMPELDLKSTIEITGSEAVMKALVAEGVEMIFGYPGGAIMPIYDALYDYRDQLEHILVRHEQGGIHAAQGYARTSGKIGTVFATSGPGATNLVTGLADALIDSTPLVCITGQVFAHLLGTDAFQEIDVINITTPVTKWNYQITDAHENPAIAECPGLRWRRAARIAIGGRGGSHVAGHLPAPWRMRVLAAEKKCRPFAWSVAFKGWGAVGVALGRGALNPAVNPAVSPGRSGRRCRGCCHGRAESASTRLNLYPGQKAPRCQPLHAWRCDRRPTEAWRAGPSTF